MKKLGIIDSGIGGITLLSSMIQKKFELDYVYICDSANVPYGDRTQSFMLGQIQTMISELGKHKVDAVFLACNTLTAQTIDLLRKTVDLPLFGIEPYIRYKYQLTSSQKCALILTPATLQSDRFQALRKEIDQEKAIDIYPMPKLAVLIESLQFQPYSAIEPSVLAELAPLQNKGYTDLILGCTHYPILRSVFEKQLQVNVIDPANQVIERIQKKIGVAIDENQTEDCPFQYSADCGLHWKTKTLKQFPFLESFMPVRGSC